MEKCFDSTNETKTKGFYISHEVASGSDIAPYNKIDKPLVAYKFKNVTL